MDIKLHDDRTFTMTGSLYELGFEQALQQELVLAARIIEDDMNPDDVDLWEALMVVIPYFSTPSQIKELKEYQANQEWINIVFNHNSN